MRLNVVPSISTKDGVSNKNARMTNMLKESRKSGDLAVIRPGLVLDAVASGVGNGLVSFNGELVSVYGTTLGLNTTTFDPDFDVSVDLLTTHSFVWHLGELFCVSTATIYKSTDYGETFTAVTGTPEATYAANTMTLLSLNSILYFFGLTTTYQSIDSGANWTVVVATPYSNASCVLGGYSYSGGPSGIYRTNDFITNTLRGTFTVSYDNPGDPVVVNNEGQILGTANSILFFVKFQIYEDINEDEITRMWIYTSVDAGVTWVEKMNTTSPSYSVSGTASGGEYLGKFCFTSDTGSGLVGTADGVSLSVVDATIGAGANNDITVSDTVFTAAKHDHQFWVDPVTLYHRGASDADTIPALSTVTGTSFDFAQSPT